MSDVMVWKTEMYGTLNVVVTGASPNGKVMLITFNATKAFAAKHPELADGTYFALPERLTVPSVEQTVRPRSRKSPVRKLAEEARVVPNRAQRRRTNEEIF